MKKLLTLFCLMTLAGLTACKDKPASISIDKVYSYATSEKQKNGAIFLTITNNTKEADKLLSAEAHDLADRIELHTHKMENGAMQMRKVDSIEIAAGSTHSLEPHGDHIMIMGLKNRLMNENSVDITLNFEKAGSIQTSATILAPGLKP